MCRYGRSPENVPAGTGYSIDSSWTGLRSIAISVTVATLAGVCTRKTGIQSSDDPAKKRLCFRDWDEKPDFLWGIHLFRVHLLASVNVKIVSILRQDPIMKHKCAQIMCDQLNYALYAWRFWSGLKNE
jgi:hypothetical protein